MDRQRVPPVSKKITRKLAQESADHNSLMNYYSKISRDETGAPKRWKMSSPMRIDEELITSGKMTSSKASPSVSRESSGERRSRASVGDGSSVSAAVKSSGRRSASRDSSSGSSRDSSLEMKGKQSKADQEKSDSKTRNIPQMNGGTGVRSDGTQATTAKTNKGTRSRPRSLELATKSPSVCNGDDDMFKSPDPLTPCNVFVKRRKGRPSETPPTLVAETPVNNSSVDSAEEEEEMEVDANISPKSGRSSRRLKLKDESKAAAEAKKPAKGSTSKSVMKRRSSKESLAQIPKLTQVKPAAVSVDTETGDSSNASAIGNKKETLEKLTNSSAKQVDISEDADAAKRKPGRPPGAKNKHKFIPVASKRKPIKKVAATKAGKSRHAKKLLIKHSVSSRSRKAKAVEVTSEDDNVVANGSEDNELSMESDIEMEEGTDNEISDLPDPDETLDEAIESMMHETQGNGAAVDGTVGKNLDKAIDTVVYKAGHDIPLTAPALDEGEVLVGKDKKKVVPTEVRVSRTVKSLAKIKKIKEAEMKVMKRRIKLSQHKKVDSSTVEVVKGTDVKAKLNNKAVKKEGKGVKKETSAEKVEVKSDLKSVDGDKSEIVETEAEVAVEGVVNEEKGGELKADVVDNEIKKESKVETTVTTFNTDTFYSNQADNKVTNASAAATEFEPQSKDLFRVRKQSIDHGDFKKFSDSESICSEVSTCSAKRLTDKQILVLGEENNDSDDSAIRTRQRFEIVPGRKRKRTLSGEFDLVDEVQLRRERKKAELGLTDEDESLEIKKRIPKKRSMKSRLRDKMLAEKYGTSFKAKKVQLLKQSPFLTYKRKKRKTLKQKVRPLSPLKSPNRVQELKDKIEGLRDDKCSETVEVSEASEDSDKPEMEISEISELDNQTELHAAAESIVEPSGNDEKTIVVLESDKHVVEHKIVEPTKAECDKIVLEVAATDETNGDEKLEVDDAVVVDNVIMNKVESDTPEAIVHALLTDVLNDVVKASLPGIDEENKGAESENENKLELVEASEAFVTESVDSRLDDHDLSNDSINDSLIDGYDNTNSSTDFSELSSTAADGDASSKNTIWRRRRPGKVRRRKLGPLPINKKHQSEEAKRKSKLLAAAAENMPLGDKKPTARKSNQNYATKNSPDSTVTRTFELRQKISRSPLDNIALKQSLEENKYLKLEQERAQRKETKLKSKQLASTQDSIDSLQSDLSEGYNDTSMDSQTEEEDDSEQADMSVSKVVDIEEMKKRCNPCSVFLVDFIKNLGIKGDDTESSDGESSADESGARPERETDTINYSDTRELSEPPFSEEDYMKAESAAAKLEMNELDVGNSKPEGERSKSVTRDEKTFAKTARAVSSPPSIKPVARTSLSPAPDRKSKERSPTKPVTVSKTSPKLKVNVNDLPQSVKSMKRSSKLKAIIPEQQTARKTVPPLKIKVKGSTRRKTYIVEPSPESPVDHSAELRVRADKKRKSKSGNKSESSDTEKIGKSHHHHHKKRNRSPTDDKAKATTSASSNVSPSQSKALKAMDGYEATFLQFIQDKDKNDQGIHTMPGQYKYKTQKTGSKPSHKVFDKLLNNAASSAQQTATTSTSLPDVVPTTVPMASPKPTLSNALPEVVEPPILPPSQPKIRTPADLFRRDEEVRYVCSECDNVVYKSEELILQHYRDVHPGSQVMYKPLPDEVSDAATVQLLVPGPVLPTPTAASMMAMANKQGNLHEQQHEDNNNNHNDDDDNGTMNLKIVDVVSLKDQGGIMDVPGGVPQTKPAIPIPVLSGQFDIPGLTQGNPILSGQHMFPGQLQIPGQSQNNKNALLPGQINIPGLSKNNPVLAGQISLAGIPQSKAMLAGQLDMNAMLQQARPVFSGHLGLTGIPTPVFPGQLMTMAGQPMGKPGTTELRIPNYPIPASLVASLNPGLNPALNPNAELHKCLLTSTSKPQPLPQQQTQQPQVQAPIKPRKVESPIKVATTFKCEKCNVHAPMLAAMVAHLRNSHKDIPKLFQCPYCKEMEAETEAKIHEHIKIMHRSDKPNSNPPVALSEPAKRNLKTLSVRLPENCKVVDNKTLERDIYLCLICKVHMPSLETIYDHLEQNHKEVFVFVCPFCKEFKCKTEEGVHVHILHVHRKSSADVNISIAIDGTQFSRVQCLVKDKPKKSTTHPTPPQKPAPSPVAPSFRPAEMLQQQTMSQLPNTLAQCLTNNQVPLAHSIQNIAALSQFAAKHKSQQPTNQARLNHTVPKPSTTSAIPQATHPLPTQAATATAPPKPPIKKKKNLLDKIEQLRNQKQNEQQGLSAPAKSPASSIPSSAAAPPSHPSQLGNKAGLSVPSSASAPPPLMRAPPPLIRYDQLNAANKSNVNTSMSSQSSVRTAASHAPSIFNSLSSANQNNLSTLQRIQGLMGVKPAQPSNANPPKPIHSSLFDTSDMDNAAMLAKPVQRPVLNVPVIPRSVSASSSPQSSLFGSSHGSDRASAGVLDLSAKNTPSSSPIPLHSIPSPKPPSAAVTPEAINADMFNVFKLKPSTQMQLGHQVGMATSQSQGQAMLAAQHSGMPQQVRQNTPSTLAYRPPGAQMLATSHMPQIINMPIPISSMMVSLANLPSGVQSMPTQLVRMGGPATVSSASTGQATGSSSTPAQSPGIQMMNLNLAMFKCPYCPKLVELTLAQVQPHIESNHPGSSILFTPIENKQ